ncbi:MAG: hypothetical protein H0X51_05125 [Parachlamydiaceae bacterium]|nr:hypothetical protein [Parachlamydiaceae bacterium]
MGSVTFNTSPSMQPMPFTDAAGYRHIEAPQIKLPSLVFHFPTIRIVKKKWHQHVVVRVVFHITLLTTIAFIARKVVKAFQRLMHYLLDKGKLTIDQYELNIRVDSEYGEASAKMLGILKSMFFEKQKKKYYQAIRHLAEAKGNQKDLIKDLAKLSKIGEILKGGYLRIEDGGETYRKWAKFKERKKRWSSHRSEGQQYAIRGNFVKEALFGQVRINGKLHSWIQLERHPAKFGYHTRHLVTYVQYKWTNKNQGPWGDSRHTEKRNPLRVAHLAPPAA